MVRTGAEMPWFVSLITSTSGAAKAAAEDKTSSAQGAQLLRNEQFT
jgi:hypothetical protein